MTEKGAKKKLTKRNAEKGVSLVATSDDGSAFRFCKPFEKGLTENFHTLRLDKPQFVAENTETQVFAMTNLKKRISYKR